MGKFVNPTIGRIVHFFTKDPDSQAEGMGTGPYAATITGVVDPKDEEQQAVHLHVLAPGKSFDATSVPVKEFADKGDHSHWWDWPPRT